MISLRVLQHPDCTTFACKEECCSAGVDVWPEERQRMIDDGVAKADDFTGPELDEEEWLYRTAIGPRGCVFLQPERGCRLHTIGYKPSVCVQVPRDAEEVAELLDYGMLPCHDHWKWG
ncbi:MAG TPA: YkgJ family cysteine cluster protein [Polyangiaceae bacterium]